MLQYGTQITQAGDPLHKLKLEQLVRGIKDPKPAFKDKIDQLRTIRSFDEKRYKNEKKYLPYFVCGIFHPARRKREHFSHIEYFTLDLDYLKAADQSVEELKGMVSRIPSVLLAFISPSGDGLKLLFKLKEKCKDQNRYVHFYKVFCHQLSKQFGLEEVLDSKTSDVTRACFMSYDAELYHNPEAEAVDMDLYFDEGDFVLSQEDFREMEAAIKGGSKDSKGIDSLDKKLMGPDTDIINQIKARLNPKPERNKVEKQYFIPQEVDNMLPRLEEECKKYEITLGKTKGISYGRQIRFEAKHLWCEINLFYGKRGYRVVLTTKSGSNSELGELVKGILESTLFELKEQPFDEQTQES